MRILFGLDATTFTNKTELEAFMKSSDIGFVTRLGWNGEHLELLWIVGKLDFTRLITPVMTAVFTYQEITSCNKQYVTQYNHKGELEFLGSVCSITQDEAMGLDTYIVDPASGEFWTFDKRNPDRLVRPARGVVEELQDAFDEIDKVVENMRAVSPSLDKFDKEAEFSIDALFSDEALKELNDIPGIAVMSLSEFMDTEMAPWPEDPAAPQSAEDHDNLHKTHIGEDPDWEYQTKFIYGHGYG